jgi:hypothetical protein
MARLAWAFAGFLLMTGAGRAGDLVEVSVKQIDSSSWAMVLTSHADHLVIQKIDANHGHCLAQTPIALPQPFAFGEAHLVGYFLCRPIDVRLTTNQGQEERSFPAVTKAGVSVAKSFDGYEQIAITAREEHLRVSDVKINRGDCSYSITQSSDHQGPQGTLLFGERLILIPSCDPTEIQITTDFGVGVFHW